MTTIRIIAGQIGSYPGLKIPAPLKSLKPLKPLKGNPTSHPTFRNMEGAKLVVSILETTSLAQRMTDKISEKRRIEMEFDTPLSYAIKVNILSDDKIIRDICSAYWALNISSPSFKKPFLYSVKTISEKYQIKPTRILPLVQKNCISVLIGLKCIKCGKNYPLKKRQNYNEAFSFYVESNDFSNEWICKECEKKAEEEAWAERRKISDKDFAYVRQVQRENMPSSMKDFELEIKKRIKPCVHKMTKTEYVHAWCMFFNFICRKQGNLTIALYSAI